MVHKDTSANYRQEDKSELRPAPISTGVSRVLKRLGDNAYFYQLKNGSSLSFVRGDGLCEVYTKNGAARQQSSYVDQSRIPINQTITFAGELNNVLYFYSSRPIINNQTKYTFYACRHENPERLTFEKLRDKTFQGEAHFAIQQPYFLNGQTIESFVGDRIEVKQAIQGSQVFFCWRNFVYLVSRHSYLRQPTAAQISDKVIEVKLPMATSLPHSIYPETDSSAYMLCGDQLLTLQGNRDIRSIYLDGHNSFCTDIAGISGGKLLMNVHSKGHPPNNVILAIDLSKTDEKEFCAPSEEKSSIVPGAKIVDVPSKQVDQNEYNQQSEEEHLAQAIYQSTLEADILELRTTVDNLTSEKNQQHLTLAQNLQLQERINVLTTENAQLQKLKADHATLQQTIKSFITVKNQLAKMEAENLTLQLTVKTLESVKKKQSQLEAENAKLKATIKTLNSEKEQQSILQADILKLQETVTRLVGERNQQSFEITRLRETLTMPSMGMHNPQNYGRLPHDFSSKFANDFEIMSILGVGGFGIVFEAENTLDDCTYAVKRISVEANEKTVDLALKEVRVMAQLDHPHIVRYNSTWVETPPLGWQEEADYETIKRFPSTNFPNIRHSNKASFIFIQMQLCKYSLAEWLKRQNSAPRDMSRIKHWFKQIVSAVAYIHDKKLIHRDLKPSNILFVAEDRIKICDLGIATPLKMQDGEEVSCTFTDVGTPLYKAPEQSPWSYSSKVDIFTLGLILTELCVDMAHNERQQIFSNYRCGKPCIKLQDQLRTAEFVSLLTQVDPNNRPKSREMLAHSFFI